MELKLSITCPYFEDFKEFLEELKRGPDTSKSEYGHRASAFRDDNGPWFVLDPYIRVNGKLDISPKKLEDYLSVIKIVKAHIYESKGYEENISLQNQNYD